MKYEGRVYTQFDTPDDQPLICDDPSLTQEHFAESCDINKIMDLRRQAVGHLGYQIGYKPCLRISCLLLICGR